MISWLIRLWCGPRPTMQATLAALKNISVSCRGPRYASGGVGDCYRCGGNVRLCTYDHSAWCDEANHHNGDGYSGSVLNGR